MSTYPVCVCVCQTLWWSGSHRVNSGEELFYSQCNVSVTGQPLRSRFTLALTNSSTAQGTNISLYTEVKILLNIHLINDLWVPKKF